MNLTRHKRFASAAAAAALGILWLSGCGGESDGTATDDINSADSRVPAEPTFTRDVAPIIFEECAGCHRPGQSAPFSLLTFADVSKRGRQIVEVIEDGYMPPWLPEAGYGDFRNARHLRSEQIATIRKWVGTGMPEGDPEALPSLPVWEDGWQLGQPDLVVSMPQPYSLAADGPDVYRNVVLPVELARERYVRALEFDPGNRRIVHHAFFMLDTEGKARSEDARDPEPGFSGIHTPPGVASPSSHFLSWQPGKQPAAWPADMTWVLRPGVDMVLQLHLQPTGKPESIQSRVALYFADQPPSRHPMKLWLSSYEIDIPAGETHYVLEDSYELSADVDVLAILPHAHFLARDMKAYATLPNGQRRWLLWIPQWDFNWQGDYQYREPVFLPQGSRLTMSYTYDNSTNNPVNPHLPPQRTRYGLQSTDEMGELWLQVLPRSEEGRAALQQDYQTRVLEDSVAYNSYLLRDDPSNPRALTGLGKALLYQGRTEHARRALEQAIAQDSTWDEPHYFLGILFRSSSEVDKARLHFEEAVRLNPTHAKAEGNLGFLALQRRDWAAAEKHLQRALELNPEDDLARRALDQLRGLQR